MVPTRMLHACMQVAYREDVSRTLAGHEKTLRSLFAAIADVGDGSRTDKLTYQLVSSERSLISVGEPVSQSAHTRHTCSFRQSEV